MAYTLQKIALTAVIDDISTAGQIYIPIPDEYSGEVVEIRTVLNGAITSVDAIITPKIGGVAMTNGAITVAFTGSAAGIVDTSRPTGANAVAEGGSIELETNGASTGAIKLFVTVVIKR